MDNSEKLTLDNRFAQVARRAVIIAKTSDPWIRWHAYLTRWTEDACLAIQELMEDMPLPAAALDVATGTGTPVLDLAKAWPQCRFEACDIATESIEIAGLLAQEENLSHISFKVCAAEMLDYPDASFDLLTCFFSLMYLRHPSGAIDQFLRVLRPGGHMVITTWTGDNQLFRLVKDTFAMEDHKYPDGQDPFMFSDTQTLKTLFEDKPVSNLLVVARKTVLNWEGSEQELWAFFKDCNPIINTLLSALSGDERQEKEQQIYSLLSGFKTGGHILFEADMLVCSVQKNALPL
ncbi:Methyltransferase domain-containing protein [Chryseobacterium carnipullorum]|uniref:class I SAM-dependent methyltransferase n=1 Tax=Chryseobacterium carnipullorum TaxID=1124835 RepID=UPI0009188BAB|nr:class I SAM-dependent methyltransferase [Chryseobacterium carnipullorum]SHM84849.1 Methyltransferase domain-containing protein [Chryseobacterium carnipullorum]